MPGQQHQTPFDGTEQWRFERVPEALPVAVHDGERRRSGRIVNISANGALLQMDELPENLENPLEPGRYVDVDIDTLPFLAARVVRWTPSVVAVSFDIHDGQCHALADQLSHAVN